MSSRRWHRLAKSVTAAQTSPPRQDYLGVLNPSAAAQNSSLGLARV